MKIKRKIIKNYWIVWLTIFSFIVLQKVAVSFSGIQFSIAFFSYFCFLFIMRINKNAAFNWQRMIWYLLMVLAATIALLINPEKSSLSSFILFLIIYSTFTIDLFIPYLLKCKAKNIFEQLLLLGAILGIAQFLVQLKGGTYFELSDFLPSSLKLAGFNTYYPLTYGSEINKSNGFFFMEPSFFSQFMALGIIIEMLNQKRILRLVILGLGLLSSFSGTGIILLVIFLMPLLAKMKPFVRNFLLFCGCIILFMFMKTEYAEVITSRIFEIKSSDSSAAIRFVNPIRAIFERPFLSILFGSGAGTCNMIYDQSIANFSAIPKVLFEYGVITTVLYMGLIFKGFFRKKGDIFSIAVVVMYLFLGGNLLQSVVAFFAYFIIEIYREYPVAEISYSNPQKR